MIATTCGPAEMRFCTGLTEDLIGAVADVLHRPNGAYPSSSNTLLSCLIDNKNHVDMEEGCRSAIDHFQIISLKDINMTPSFRLYCIADAKRLCPDILINKLSKSSIRGALVSCLSEVRVRDVIYANTVGVRDVSGGGVRQPLLSHACANQLRYELLQRSESILHDPELAADCQTDWARFCQHVKPGNAQVLSCLKKHRKSLTLDCHARLFKRDLVAAAESRGDYELSRDCHTMIRLHCRHIISDSRIDSFDMGPRLLDCLVDRLRSDDSSGANGFDETCRKRVMAGLELRSKDYRLDPRLQIACE
ncbi:unnamed protein product [Protopolystoma xenopodis]|uniref:Uncharacterized protein n=1 Tax=Protopolystoma xenopodis TaxID=117903 RepID=A0A3S5CMW4_9PLAT|nr:unnamed protein product [Protopolystoma xenopodis]